MIFKNKALGIKLNDFKSPQMRAFHMSWFAFFLCFFGWFGIAPLLSVVRDDLGITTDQIITTNMVAVASTIVMRLLIGVLCDRIGPRITYTWLLIIGSIPVMCIGFAHDYTTFLIARMLIGMIGAAFVITQFHTTIMFAPNCVGTANATSAGWGNLGGGVTQQIMPLVFAAIVTFGLEPFVAWRVAMIAPGILLFLTGIAYFFLTQDAPDGNFSDLRKTSSDSKKKAPRGSLLKACKDYRVWILFLIYGACFGVELTVNSNAVLYFVDYFDMDLQTAGLVAGIFGLMNLFARTLGGALGDRFGIRNGLKGRTRWLFITLLCESFALILFSRMEMIPAIIASIVVFSLFVQMSEGATYSLVPFIDKKNIGLVSGVVGAGGNVGAVLAMFLFKKQLTGLEWTDSFLILGFIVMAASFLTFAIR